MRPFLSVRPSYSSLPDVPASTTSLYVLSPPSAVGSSVTSTLTLPSTPSSAWARKVSTALSAAAGSAATGARAAVLGRADADDPAQRAAVLEEAVDGVREVARPP